MDFETESQKKKCGVLGDVLGGVTMVLPKELDEPIPLPSPPPLAVPFELRFQLPDLKLAFRVCASCLLLITIIYSPLELKQFFVFYLFILLASRPRVMKERESYSVNK
jgi:hypothetical protein